MSLSLRVQSISSLGARYGQAFKQAWQARRAMEPVQRLPHEAQFLPAVLSLQETPISPAPRVVMWLLLAFAAIAVTWACVGRIDVVAVAQGKVVPSDRTKTIQSFETATVQAIHVSDGQSVKAGDLLIELDATTAQADQGRLQADLISAKLQIARGQAMLAALNTERVPQLAFPKDTPADKGSEAQRLLTEQLAEYHAKRTRIEAETAKREAELRSIQALVRKLEQTLPIAAKRAEDYKNLVNQNFVSQHGYLEHEQARIEQEADLANLRSRLKESEAALNEAHSQRVGLAAETRRQSLDSMTEGGQKVTALEQELRKADSRGKLMQLKAPVDGTVQQLAVHTIGGVVTPAQALMAIVPRDHPLEVEAFIENKDIGFIKAQQPAEVKIETFQFTKYGTIPARVTSVSHDAIQDEKRGLIYSTRVKMEKTALLVDGAEVKLTPGMAVSVEVKTGQRRVIEYFLAPLLRHKDESLRER